MLNNNKGFSLIELSIVLIILGLLVAGVVGGQSLIQSAKAKRFLNELSNWKRSYNAFYAANGRLPGDINNKGITGLYSGHTYPAGTFASPYNAQQSENNAPFIEMYLENISEFRPLSGNCNVNLSNAKLKCVPLSNVLKNSFYSLVYYNQPATSDVNNWRYGLDIDRKTMLMLTMDGASGSDKDSTKILTIKLLKYVDEKIDDGKQNRGELRVTCKGVDSNGTVVASGVASYDQAIEALQANDDGYCKTLSYGL